MNEHTTTTAQDVIDRIEARNALTRFRIWYRRVYSVYSVHSSPTREHYEKCIVAIAKVSKEPVQYVCECLKYPTNNSVCESKNQKPNSKKPKEL